MRVAQKPVLVRRARCSATSTGSARAMWRCCSAAASPCAKPRGRRLVRCLRHTGSRAWRGKLSGMLVASSPPVYGGALHLGVALASRQTPSCRRKQGTGARFEFGGDPGRHNAPGIMVNGSSGSQRLVRRFHRPHRLGYSRAQTFSCQPVTGPRGSRSPYNYEKTESCMSFDHRHAFFCSTASQWR